LQIPPKSLPGCATAPFRSGSTAARCLLAALALAASQGSGAAAPRLMRQDVLLEHTDRMIVRYRNATATAVLDTNALMSARVAGNRVGIQVTHERRSSDGAHVLRISKRLTLATARQMAADIRAGDANVEYAEPDRLLQAQWTPTDSQYAQQWDLFEATAGMNMPAAWDKSTGTGVVVAVLDTGIRPHADLKANLLAGYDFINTAPIANDGGGRDADPADAGDWATAGTCYSGSPASNSSWHGTHVAGTIAAVTNNGSGIAGVAPGARVLPLRVLGRCGGYTSDIADAIIWASGGTVAGVPANPTPARVINLSLGGSGACDVTTQRAIDSARSRGTVVVVAAGNSNADAANFSPASCAGVIAVASVGRTGGKASYSNYGNAVTLAAPGGDSGAGILSTLNAGTTTPGADAYASYMGTSMATPHVAGVAALMLARNPTLTPDDIATRLKSSARAFPATCNLCGAGLVDASAAIDAAGGGTTAPAPTPTPSPTPAPTPTVTAVAEVENNNSLATAQAIATNPALVRGTLAKASDTDYFRVRVGAGKTLAVTLQASLVTANHDLYVYGPTGSLMLTSRNRAGLPEAVMLRNAGATEVTVSLRVVHVSGGSGATHGLYTLSLAQ
jgi:serine protease